MSGNDGGKVRAEIGPIRTQFKIKIGALKKWTFCIINCAVLYWPGVKKLPQMIQTETIKHMLDI